MADKKRSKYRVGQVVFCRRCNTYKKVVGSFLSLREPIRAYQLAGDILAHRADEIRSLTAREKGKD